MGKAEPLVDDGGDGDVRQEEPAHRGFRGRRAQPLLGKRQRHRRLSANVRRMQPSGLELETGGHVQRERGDPGDRLDQGGDLDPGRSPLAVAEQGVEDEVGSLSTPEAPWSRPCGERFAAAGRATLGSAAEPFLDPAPDGHPTPVQPALEVGELETEELGRLLVR